MIREEIRKKIADAGYENAILYDNQSYDNSIIGIDDEGRVVYDYNKMAQEIVDEDTEEQINEYKKALPDEERDSMTEDEIICDLLMQAYEWVDYNTIRATPYMGSLAPVIISDVSYMLEGDDTNKPHYQNMITGEEYNNEIIFKI